MYNEHMSTYMPVLHNLYNALPRLIDCKHIYDDRYVVLEANYLTSDVVTGDVVQVKLSLDIERPVLEIVRTLGRFKYIMTCRGCKGNTLAPARFDDCTLCGRKGSLDVTWCGYMATDAENFGKIL